MRAVARKVGWSSTMRTVVVTGTSWRRAATSMVVLALPRRDRIGVHGALDAAEGRGRVVLAEDGGPGDEQRGAGVRARAGGVLVDAAVDLEVDVGPEQRAQPPQLVERGVDEGLAAPAGVD